MRIKIEYAVPILVIVVVSVYLFVQRSGKIQYSLPVVQTINKSDISKIITKKGDSEITLLRENDKWFVGPQKYPADIFYVHKILESIAGFTLTALSSESENYFIYELDEKNKIGLEAYKGEEVALKIDIGKPAPSFQHTFVKLANDRRVFLSEGNLNNNFSKTIDELRDKAIMTFDEDITELTIQKDKEKMIFVKKSTPPSPSQAIEQEQKDTKQEIETKWVTSEGGSVEQEAVEEIIRTLSRLKCESFIDNKKKEDFPPPTYTVSLKGIKTYTLSFFEKEKTNYPAISSESNSLFLISQREAKKIMKDPSSLIEEEE